MTTGWVKQSDFTKITQGLSDDTLYVGYSEQQQHSSGFTMAQLGAMMSEGFIHHGENIPPRPHLEEGLGEAKELLKVAIKKYLRAKKRTQEPDTNNLVTIAKDAVSQYVYSGALRGIAPNAPSTIQKKGHDLPLVDTGELVDQGLKAFVVRRELLNVRND